MKKSIIILLVFIPLFALGQVQIARVDSLFAAFKQVRESSALLEPDVKTGELVFIAPDSIRWEYTENRSFRLPDPMLRMIRQAVEGDEKKLQNAFLTEWENETLTLTPKQNKVKRFFSRIQILFTPDGVARQVILYDPNGDKTSITFSNIRYKRL